MIEPLSLSARRIKRTFPRSGFTLDVESFDVAPGRVAALLGPSGSGKSTLLEVLGLLAEPDSGEVLVGGRAVTRRDRDVRLRMAAVFQRPYLFKGSVAANVGYGLALRGVAKAARVAPVAAALARVGLEGFEDRSVAGLSGGEAQRVSLARALVIEPRILLLDEPLASLDPLLKRELTREFASILRDAQVTAVWVTHDQDEALVVADDVAILNRGRVVASGKAEAVMSLPADEWTARFLGVAGPMLATATPGAEGLVSLACAGQVIYATGEVSVGERVIFAVLPEDVTLYAATAELPASSARNHLRATVTGLNPRGTTVGIALQAGELPLVANVSRTSAEELGLVPGSEVWAVFKATAVRWRSSDG